MYGIRKKEDKKHGFVYDVISYRLVMGVRTNVKFISGSYIKKSDAEKVVKIKNGQ